MNTPSLTREVGAPAVIVEEIVCFISAHVHGRKIILVYLVSLVLFFSDMLNTFQSTLLGFMTYLSGRVAGSTNRLSIPSHPKSEALLWQL